MTIKFEWPPKNIIFYTRKKHKFKQYGEKIKKKKKKKKKKIKKKEKKNKKKKKKKKDKIFIQMNGLKP